MVRNDMVVRWWLSAWFVVLAAGSVSAQVAILTDDAHVRNTVKEAGLNFGLNPNLQVSPDGPAYLKFNVGVGLPPGTPGAAVERATLRLYLSNVIVAGSLDIHAIADSWDEKTITANTAPPLTTLLGTTDHIDMHSRHEFLVLDVTSIVRQWLGDDGLGANGLPNHGLALASHGLTQVTFDSKENSQTSHQGELLIQLRSSGGAGGIASVGADMPLSVSNPTTSPTISLGIVPAAHGGTGLTSPGAAGNFLRSAGGAWTAAPLTAADLPDLAGSYIRNATASQTAANFNIAGTGTADVLNAATQFNLGGSRILTNAGTNNLFAGNEAGSSNTTGSANAFFGRNAGQANSSGSSNSFGGYNAGAGNTTGGRNSFFGDAAGFRNAGANDNAFFGFLAGFHNTANANSYFGSLAGADNTTGAGNSFFGMNAGVHNTTGSGNAFYGYFAGASNTTSLGNSFFGSFAGVNTAGALNSFFGGDAGFHNTTGGDNAFVGYKSGYGNTSGSGNTFLGRGAGVGNTTGNSVTVIGAGANVGADNLSFATAIGAGSVVSTSNTIVLGRSTDSVEVRGGLNVAGSFGANILNAEAQFNLGGDRILVRTGQDNLFVGIGAGASNTIGVNNSFLGASAGITNSTGSDNAFFGRFAGGSNTAGTANAFFGANAAVSNTMGSINSSFGAYSANKLTTGDENSFFGASAGFETTTGSANSFFGRAGATNTTGSRNTLVGYQADVGTGNLNFATALGAGAKVNTSNTVVLGRAVDAVRIPGTLNVAGSIGANVVNASVQFNLDGDRILSTTGSNNLFLGIGVGASNTIGHSNAFFGPQAGVFNSTGNANAFFGSGAGFSNSTGGGNSFFGQASGQFNASGIFNTFVGANAGNKNVTGTGNSFFGSFAGYDNVTGNSLTLIGANTGAGADPLQFATAIGAGAVVYSSNTVVLGRGVDTVQVPGSLQVNGSSVLVGTPGHGIILKSPDGVTCRLLSIDNAGNLSLAAMACP